MIKIKDRVEKIITYLDNLFPNAHCELNYTKDYELLIAIVLSAQTTDKRVNKVTSGLFKDYGTPEKMITLSQEELAKIILPCGLNNSKSKNILGATKSIIENFGGVVPSDYDSLLSLPGVGRKTANVVYSVAFDMPAIAVDTHVFRVSNRIGLAKAKTPEQTEKQLMKAIEKNKWSQMHHYLIYHGRQVCSARSPKCEDCVIKELCAYKNKKV